jgi:molybdate transport system substrate-binding protein
MVRLDLVAALVLVSCGKEPARGPGAPAKIAAASDLARAFPAFAKAFEAKTGESVVFSFGSSGNFAKQLKQGAPFDLFASANIAFADEVVAAGVCDGATQARYGRGRIVIWTKKGSAVAPPRSLEDLADARFVKIGLANPEHAPYGKAARQALEARGLWPAVQPKLVYGENIQQTHQLARTGNVEAAIVALSLAIVADDGEHVLIDEALHKPLDQALVVCNRGANRETARRFAEFVASPEGREIMSRFGFVVP